MPSNETGSTARVWGNYNADHFSSKWAVGLEMDREMSSSSSVNSKVPLLSGTGQILAVLAKGDRDKFTRFFTRVRQAYPEEVARIALKQIAGDPESRVGRAMAEWLATQAGYVALLFDPEFLPLAKAHQALAAMRAADPKFAGNLLRGMEEMTTPEFLMRALTLIEDSADYSPFYARLSTLTRHPNNHIRSKAVLALCRMRPHRSLIDRQLESPDARVRANAVEALWHAPAGLATRVFREALADDHHRVVVNALLGFYHQKDDSYYDKMMALSKHPGPRFRVALAWALGEIREERLMPLREKLAADSSAEVRARAAASLAKLSQSEFTQPE